MKEFPLTDNKTISSADHIEEASGAAPITDGGREETVLSVLTPLYFPKCLI